MSKACLTRFLTLAALTLGTVAPSFAQFRRKDGGQDQLPPLPPLLQQALRSGGPKRFAGERVVEFRRGPNRKRHREFIVKDGSRYRIEFPNDSEFAGQIIVDNGEKRLHYFPDLNEIHQTPPRRDEANMRIRSMHGRFKGRLTFQEEQPQSVAGIRATPFAARDKAGNVFLRIWVDPRSQMALKREFYDHVGTSVGLLEYTRIDFTPNIKPDDFRIRREGAKTISPETLTRRLMKKAGMAEVFLAKGHGVELEHARLLEGPGKPMLIQIYKGPNGPVSFYQFQGEVNPERLRKQAGTEFRTTSWSANGRTYVIVGELTEDQLKTLARTVQ